jgi:hypothetical protein
MPGFMHAEDAPSAELLEFLGNWETDEGEWQDPLEFMKDLDAMEGEAKDVNVEDVQDGQ